MPIELTILLSVASVCVSVIMATHNISRNRKQDTTAEVAERARQSTKLDNIDSGIKDIKNDIIAFKSDIKSDMNGVSNKMETLGKEIVRIDESTKQAHKRINTLEEKIK